MACTSRIAEPVKKDCELVMWMNLRITRFVLKDNVGFDTETESVKVDRLHTEERSKFAIVLTLKVHRTIVIKSLTAHVETSSNDFSATYYESPKFICIGLRVIVASVKNNIQNL